MGRLPHICTIAQLANETKISAYTIRQWAKEGKLKTLRSGKKYLINYDIFINFLNGNEQGRGQTQIMKISEVLER